MAQASSGVGSVARVKKERRVDAGGAAGVALRVEAGVAGEVGGVGGWHGGAGERGGLEACDAVQVLVLVQGALNPISELRRGWVGVIGRSACDHEAHHDVAASETFGEVGAGGDAGVKLGGVGNVEGRVFGNGARPRARVVSRAAGPGAFRRWVHRDAG